MLCIQVRVHDVKGFSAHIDPQIVVQLGNRVEHLKSFGDVVVFEAEDIETASRGIVIRILNKNRGKEAIGSVAIPRFDRGMTTEWLPLQLQGQKKVEICVSLRLMVCVAYSKSIHDNVYTPENIVY